MLLPSAPWHAAQESTNSAPIAASPEIKISGNSISLVLSSAAFIPADKIKDIMESAVDLEVPNKVDYESGPNWGTIKWG